VPRKLAEISKLKAWKAGLNDRAKHAGDCGRKPPWGAKLTAPYFIRGGLPTGRNIVLTTAT